VCLVHSQYTQLAAGPGLCRSEVWTKAVTAMKIVPCTAGLSRMWQECRHADCYMLLIRDLPLSSNRNNSTLVLHAADSLTQQAAGMFVRVA
jgi:hypothetical protein